jgi:hypothetical protein
MTETLNHLSTDDNVLSSVRYIYISDCVYSSKANEGDQYTLFWFFVEFGDGTTQWCFVHTFPMCNELANFISITHERERERESRTKLRRKRAICVVSYCNKNILVFLQHQREDCGKHCNK